MKDIRRAVEDLVPRTDGTCKAVLVAGASPAVLSRRCLA